MTGWGGRLAISGLGRFGSLGLLAVLCAALVDELTGAISCGAVRRPRRPAPGPRSRPSTSTRATTTFMDQLLFIRRTLGDHQVAASSSIQAGNCNR